MNTDQLPVREFLAGIGQTVQDCPVTIVVGETGSGKTTLVPAYLAFELGYRVAVTQPRRLAARNVATRVAQQNGTLLGELVGFETAEEHYISPRTQLVFRTDGLQLAYELTDRNDYDILVVDEVHEWNRNIETLVAWVKYQMAQGRKYRVVLMSATLEAERLSEYFGGAPIITVPGRLFPVETIVMEGTPAEIATHFATQGLDVLIFMPGKAEIDEVIQDLKATGMSGKAEILPLHGGLSPDEQNRVFRRYSKPRIIVSTNVAQTSITIDGIVVVVDPAKEKRIEVRDGVEGLYICEISQTDCKQREGRAGRTQPGKYVYCSDMKLSARPMFPTAEILRSRLDQLVLRLANIGLDATELEFFHQPERSALVEAKRALQRLGALDGEGKITEIGQAMSRLPVDVHYARMIVEAEKRGVTDEVLTIVACLQAGGIRGKGKKIDGQQFPPRWPELTSEKDSDLLADLDCYLAACGMGNKRMYDMDILVKKFREAKEIRARLARELGASLHPSKTNDRTEILKAVVAGMVDNLYRYYIGGGYWGASDSIFRKLDDKSVVARADWITAMPFDIETIVEREGMKFPITIHLVVSVTKVDPAWLTEVAPQLAKSEPRGFSFDTQLGEVVSIMSTVFNGHDIGRTSSPAYECPEATLTLAEALVEGLIDYPDKEHNESIRRLIAILHRRHSREVKSLTIEDLASIFAERLGTVYKVIDLSQVNLKLELADFVPAQFLDEVNSLEPETIIVDRIPCLVKYDVMAGSRVYATVQVPRDQLSQLVRLPLLPKADGLNRVEAVDGAGEVVAGSYSLGSLQRNIEESEKEARKQAEQQKLLDEIKQLQHQCDDLALQGRAVVNLRHIIAEARSKLRAAHRWWTTSSTGDVRPFIRQAENEIERLSGDAATVLLDDLMNGRIWHPDITHNQSVIERLNAYVIRSGGFIECLTDDQLRQHYQQCLGDTTYATEVGVLDLKLSLENFAPTEILEDLDLAPDSVELEGRKGSSSYAITYSYEEIDGERTAVGSISVPIAVYERNCAEVGRKAGFPALPHGIRLIITVTESKRTVARGEDGEQLQRQIKRHQRGKARGKSAPPATDELGLARRGPVIGDAPPPWYTGRAR